MVLNLLFTRSLEEARAFLDRSFAAYLGGQGVQASCVARACAGRLPAASPRRWAQPGRACLGGQGVQAGSHGPFGSRRWLASGTAVLASVVPCRPVRLAAPLTHPLARLPAAWCARSAGWARLLG